MTTAVGNFSYDYDILDRLIGVTNHSGTYYFLKDGLGSITDITNSGGDIVQKFVYSSFGKILSIKDGNNQDISTSPTVAPYFTYTNREFDAESNLYYYRARYYDSSIGRFLQQDPHPGFLIAANILCNKYIYSSNSPTILTDPNGQLPLIVIAILVGAALGGIKAAIEGESIWHGVAMGAVYGLVIGAGASLGAAIAASAGATGMTATAIEAISAGVITGLFNAQTGAGTFKQGFLTGFSSVLIAEAIDFIFTSAPAGNKSDNVIREGEVNNFPDNNYNPSIEIIKRNSPPPLKPTIKLPPQSIKLAPPM